MRNLLLTLALFLASSFSGVQAQAQTADVDTAKYNVRQIINQGSVTSFNTWSEHWTVKGDFWSWWAPDYVILTEAFGRGGTPTASFTQRVEKFRWTTFQARGERLVYKFVVAAPANIYTSSSTVGHVVFLKNDEEVGTAPLFIQAKRIDIEKARLTIRSLLKEGVWMTQVYEYNLRSPHLPNMAKETITDEGGNVLQDFVRIRSD